MNAKLKKEKKTKTISIELANIAKQKLKTQLVNDVEQHQHLQTNKFK